MGLTGDEAVSVVASARQLPPESLRPTRLGGTDLWSVAFVDEGSGLPLPGALTVVGPDRRIWVFSSNPAIHNAEIVVSALAEIYRAGAAPFVEADKLAARISEATEAQRQLIRTIVSDAKASALRTQGRRHLP